MDTVITISEAPRLLPKDELNKLLEAMAWKHARSFLSVCKAKFHHHLLDKEDPEASRRLYYLWLKTALIGTDEFAEENFWKPLVREAFSILAVDEGVTNDDEALQILMPFGFKELFLAQKKLPSHALPNFFPEVNGDGYF